MEILVNGKVKKIDLVCRDKETGQEIENSWIADYLYDNNIKHDYEYFKLNQEEYNDMLDFWESEMDNYNNGYSEFLGEYKENITYYFQER